MSRDIRTVSEGGLEPPRPEGHQPLKLARLPIPPLRRGMAIVAVVRAPLSTGLSGTAWLEGATRVGRPKPLLVPSHRNLAIDRTSHRDESAQDNGGRRANNYLVAIVVRGGQQGVGQGGNVPRRCRRRVA